MFDDVGSFDLYCRLTACANRLCLHRWLEDSDPAIEKYTTC